MKRHSLSSTLFAVAALALPTAPLGATLIATDGDVPTSMGAGGTAENLAVYIIGETPGYVHEKQGQVVVGNGSQYNHLTVQAGAALISSNVTAGWSGGDHNNSILATGENTIISVSNNLIVGYYNNNNSLRIEDGATVTTSDAYGNVYIGQNNAASDNLVTITGEGSSLTSGGYLTIGGAGGTGNTIDVLDGGLLKMTETFWYMFGVTEGNFLRIDDGFFAWNGNHTSDIASFLDGEFQVLNGSTWVTGGADDFEVNYFDTDEAAEAFSGYTGLGGYTIITSASAIPEPSAYAAIFGGLALGCTILRRRRRA